MDNTEVRQAHGRVFAARKRLTEFLAQHMSDTDVEEAMAMVNDLCRQAHFDGAEWGAVRERTAAQLRGQKPDPDNATEYLEPVRYDESDVNAQFDMD